MKSVSFRCPVHVCVWLNFCNSSWRNPVLLYFPQSQTEKGSWVGQDWFEVQKSILVLWTWTHLRHALAVVCGVVHYRYGDWIQSCVCTSSPFSDMILFPKLSSQWKQPTHMSLKIAIFEIRIEFTYCVLGECYFRAITEFGVCLKTPNFQAKSGWLAITFRGWVRPNFYFEG